MTRASGVTAREGGSSDHRYGRGKFPAHENYVAYMRTIVEHPTYRSMPNAVSSDGRINWQVSSGKTTSFYAYYQARWEWWVERADECGLSGTGNEQDRFSIAARRIHPTGYRACRLCGEERNVGYFYLNYRLTKRLNKTAEDALFEQLDPIDAVLETIAMADQDRRELLVAEIENLFPERAKTFAEFGVVPEAFERTQHVRSRWLSPGFMANPPDRLDGFHDYCVYCRAENDPGRSAQNLRSYQHDRRAFQWWAEGDWALADELYNSAGPGVCAMCDAQVDKVSPDHVGPLACGFKQLPLFVPACQPCNSSKNRRMRVKDVERLLEYEERSGNSAASWQVRGLWDAQKGRVESDAEAQELSALMRGLQDGFLRVLYMLLCAGEARFLSTLLSPQFAFFAHAFENLDPATLTFSDVKTTRVDTPLRRSLATRSVRIAFDELVAYVKKAPEARKLRRDFDEGSVDLGEEVIARCAEFERTDLDDAWAELFRMPQRPADLERGIAQLFDRHDAATDRKDSEITRLLKDGFYRLGHDAVVALS